MEIDGIPLKAGDLLIEKANGLWGALVRALFGKDHQHVRAVVHGGRTIEAVWDGVKLTDLPATLDRYEVWRPRCDYAIRLVAVQRMHVHLSEAYGYASVLMLVLRRRLGLPVPDGPGLYCSELIAQEFTRSGYDLVPGRPDADTAPWDLRNPERLDCLKA